MLHKPFWKKDLLIKFCAFDITIHVLRSFQKEWFFMKSYCMRISKKKGTINPLKGEHKGIV